MRQLVYVDLGIPDAKAFWTTVALPSVQAFRTGATTLTSLMAAWSLWHMNEWLWYDTHPGETARVSQAYKDFTAGHTSACPDLLLLRDVAEASKHRALSRKGIAVDKVTPTLGRHGRGGYNVVDAVPVIGSGIPQHLLYCKDGTAFWIADVIERSAAYWQNGLDSGG